MRYRRSRCIYCEFNGREAKITNFLSGLQATCKKGVVDALYFMDESMGIEDIANSRDTAQIISFLPELIRMGAIVVAGSDADKLEQKYVSDWEWGSIAAIYHFGIRDTPYLSPPEEREWLSQRIASRPSPPLYKTHNKNENIRLKPFMLSTHVRYVLFDRRTERRFSDCPIKIDQLSDCLFAGLGITGFYDEPLYGRMPLKMTPSGGARNPFEAYVVVSRVDELSNGVYHYSAYDHGLALLSSRMPKLSRIVGNQDWADRAAAMIILVANVDRDMWKYPNPAAYRCTLIEAGHIVQNIQLLATELGLCSAPTAAINDSYADSLFCLEAIKQSAIYTISLGHPVPEYAKWYEERPLQIP